MSFISSVFDSDCTAQSKFKLWERNKNKIIPDQYFFFNFKAFKKTRKSPEDFVLKKFHISNNLFCYTKSLTSTKIVGVMDLEWVRFEVIEHFTVESRLYYEIKFIKNLKIFNLRILPGKDFDTLVQILCQNCTRTDFFKKYSQFNLISMDESKMVKKTIIF